MLRNYW